MICYVDFEDGGSFNPLINQFQITIVGIIVGMTGIVLFRIDMLEKSILLSQDKN